MKKRVLLSSVLFGFIILLNIIIVSAELDLKITGIIGDYNSDIRLKTSSSSATGFDAYDMKSPSSPSNYSSFSSTVGSNTLTIDSWNSANNPRTLNLTYALPSALSGNLALSWNSAGVSSAFTAIFKNYGDDSTYTTQVGSNVNMASTSSTDITLTSDSNVYFQILIADVVVAEEELDSADSGGSGGGGGAPTKKETLISEDNGIFIGDLFIDVFSGLGRVKSRKIELYNEDSRIISGTLRIEGDEIKDLIQLADTSFSLDPKEKGSINFTIIVPEDKELGIYTGKIILTGKYVQEIEVKITVSKQELLFDAGIEISWDYKIIEYGDNLPVQVTLIPMVDNPRFDVRVSYFIRDLEDESIVFHQESKTLKINGTWNEKIDFPIADMDLDPGKYVLELELEYPFPEVQSFASARSSFEIRPAGLTSLFDSRLILLILGLGGFILIVLIGLLILRYKKKKKHK